MLSLSPMPLASMGQTETHRMHPMQSSELTPCGFSNEMASVGHSLAQVPHLVQVSLAVG